MASSTRLQTCSTCQKSQGQVLCAGCERWFCIKHLLEHRQDLSRELEKCVLERDQLQAQLIADDNDRQHPLLSRVDRWEAKSIEVIKQVAQQVRSELRNVFSRSKRHIEESLRPITDELEKNQQTDDYTENELKRWTSQLKQLKAQLEKAPMVQLMHDEDERPSTHLSLIQLRVPQKWPVPSHITEKTRWLKSGRTVAGGRGQGDALNQLHFPLDLDIDDDGSFYIADMHNHRIVRWRPNAAEGETVAGGKGRGDQTDQLNEPVAVLIDRLSDCLIISDGENQRVMRWPLQKSAGTGEKILSNILLFGMAMDDEGSLYVSDCDKHEVRRHGRGDGREGVIVAGGHGKGAALNQLDGPRQIFVDADQSLYASDRDNHRVMKWVKGARDGVVVAGGRGKGNSLAQLYSPSGIFVDRTGSVYVMDQGNDRVMRWVKGAKTGEVLVGGNGRGSQNDQFNQPASILLDDRGNLYVVDRSNHRVQCFDLQ